MRSRHQEMGMYFCTRHRRYECMEDEAVAEPVGYKSGLDFGLVEIFLCISVLLTDSWPTYNITEISSLVRSLEYVHPVHFQFFKCT